MKIPKLKRIKEKIKAKHVKKEKLDKARVETESERRRKEEKDNLESLIRKKRN